MTVGKLRVPLTFVCNWLPSQRLSVKLFINKEKVRPILMAVSYYSLDTLYMVHVIYAYANVCQKTQGPEVILGPNP
jgi:hypothetical protein